MCTFTLQECLKLCGLQTFWLVWNNFLNEMRVSHGITSDMDVLWITYSSPNRLDAWICIYPCPSSLVQHWQMYQSDQNGRTESTEVSQISLLRHFVKIGRSDGLLSVARKVDLHSFTEKSRATVSCGLNHCFSENFILLHFNTFVHGQNCFIKYKRKNLNPDAYMYLLTGYETCFTWTPSP